jgi:hypothetical protein
MEKVDSNNSTAGRDQSTVSEPRENLGIDVFTPCSISPNQYESAPILSLFDNAVFGRGSADGPSTRSSNAWHGSTTASSPQVSTPCNQPQSKLERLRRVLVAMLPSQHDVDLLADEKTGWWVIRRHVLPQSVKYEPYSFLLTLKIAKPCTRFPDHEFSKPYSVQGVSQLHPIMISRLLLCIALCIQQLPPTYNPCQLQITGSLKDHMERYVNNVATVTSDDELIGSLEGIECLM